MLKKLLNTLSLAKWLRDALAECKQERDALARERLRLDEMERSIAALRDEISGRLNELRGVAAAVDARLAGFDAGLNHHGITRRG